MSRQDEEQQIQRSNEPIRQQKFEPGSLQEQDNLLIEMLTSDKIIDIAIFVCFLGVIILAYCCYLVDGHLRFHLGFILFLMFGLGISLMIYKCLHTETTNSEEQSEKQEKESIHKKAQKSSQKLVKSGNNNNKKAKKNKQQKSQ